MLCCSGTYYENEKAEKVQDCVDCTAGFYCPGESNTEPLPCEKGNYSDSGAAVCSVCEAGYYCDQTANSKTFMLTERICPAGWL